MDIEKKCVRCGTTLSQINKNMMLGCADCYFTFSEELEPKVKNLHALKQKNFDEENKKRVAVLQSKFEDAVSQKNWDEAEKLAHLINQMGVQNV